MSTINDSAMQHQTYLDFQSLCNNELKSKHGFEFPYSHKYGNSTPSLTNLCLLCTDMGLDKPHQISNWERRPLHPDKILYVAQDAHCLILFYHIIRQQFNCHRGWSFQDYIAIFLAKQPQTNVRRFPEFFFSK